MRTLRRIARNERGFALVLALGVTVVLSMTVITVVESTTANQHSSGQTKNRASAYDLAEAGINDAASVITQGPNSFDPHLLHPQGTYALSDCANPPANPAGAPLLGNTCSPYVQSYDGGTVTYWGRWDSTNQNWTVTSTGDLRNPYGGQDTTRTVVAVIHVRPRASQLNYMPAWNYVFAKDTTPNVCNVTLQQSTALTSSLYTEGNLCFKNTGDISETNSNDPVNLEVRGSIVWLSGSSRGVGDASVNPTQYITTAKVAGGCGTGSVDNQGVLTKNTPHTCSPNSPTNDYFYVKSGGYSTSAPQITSPTLTSTDWDNYYQTASISRLNPCNSGGLAASSFDNDTTRNDSLTPAFNLTPGTNFSCRTTDASGAVLGELDWDATNHILSVRGTVYIDGDVTISGLVKYRGVDSAGAHPAGSNGSDGTGGQMVMYVSGTVSLSLNGVFCGWNTNNDTAAYIASSNTCDFSAWTPATSMFMFVANGGVTLNQGAYFQGAIFTPGSATLGQSAITEGPFITNTLSLGQSVQMKPLPGLADLPLGAPGNPNTSGVPEAPQYQNG